MTSALIVSNRYPQIKTQAEAFDQAMQMSASYRHLFVYVRLSTTTGLYEIDLVGNQYSDSKIIASFFNKQKTL